MPQHLMRNPFDGFTHEGWEPAPDSPAAEFCRLHKLAASRHDDLAAMKAQHEAAVREVSAAREALVSAMTATDSTRKEITDLEARLAKANQTAGEPWAERVEAAGRNAQKALSVCHTFAASNVYELLAEFLPAGYAAQAGVLSVPEMIAERLAFFAEIDARVTQLLVPSGLRARDVMPKWQAPRSPQSDANEAYRRAPVPLPADIFAGAA